MNIGDGVPCTLRHLQGETIPELPPPEDRSKQFAGEIDEHCKDSIRSLRKLIEKIDDMKLPKGKSAELKSVLGKAIQQLQSNLPFIAESFGKHTEKTVEKAKQEIHGYMLGVITRSGLAALGAKPPLLLENKNEDD